MFALLALFCGLIAQPAAAQSGPRNCGTLSQVMYVRDVMDEYYFWYRELPRVNPANYANPEAYLEAVRYRPLDSSFSYITSRAANEAFYGESQFVGFGFSTQTTETEMRILQVFPDSPASEAGLARGDRIVEINGRSVRELIDTGLVGGAFGATEPGVTATVTFQSLSGEQRRASMTKRVVTIPTVSLTRTFRVDGRTVGYLFFRNFVNPSYAALDDAFQALKTAGATELVVDLRYNGGGLVDVAVHLASLVGGVATQDRVFATFQHNDKNTSLNEDLRFKTATPQSLNLSRLFVLTTRGSASASELLINSLRPYMPVVVVGDATYGKPVGQYGFTFCDKVLAPVAFALVNVEGRGDFFGGIEPDCPASDDIEHELGSAEEASLSEALHYVRTGSCRTSATSRATRAKTTVQRAVGWQALVNAH
jgi:carboxyl-terminal processing protease